MEDVDDHFATLTEMHEDEYSILQQRLWARTINCGTHDSFEIPPALPMFAPPPKRSKKDSLTDTVPAVLAKAISPDTATTKDASRLDHLPLSSSPGKSADLRMKNLQQQRYIQQLFEVKISSEDEFLEQKSDPG